MKNTRETTALFDQAAAAAPVEQLGDFTTTGRVVWITALAVGIGALVPDGGNRPDPVSGRHPDGASGSWSAWWR